MDATDADGKRVGGLPPYCSFQSVKTLLGSLKEHGLPGRIDRTLLTNFSGSVAKQVLSALRFLRLTDAEGNTTPALRNAVDAFGTEAWSEVLSRIIRDAYSPIFDIDLDAATPGQFNRQFAKTYPSKDAVLRKCVVFFLNAATEAQIPISQYILKDRKPRTHGAQRKPRIPRAAPVKPRPIAGDSGADLPPGATSDAERGRAEFRQHLLAKFPDFDPSWSDALKAEWFKGFEQFMAMTKK